MTNIERIHEAIWAWFGRKIDRFVAQGWRFVPGDPYEHPVFPDDWAVMVHRYEPGGGYVDGPLLLFVNKQSHEVSSLDEKVTEKHLL
jgi:hypothetical protein